MPTVSLQSARFFQVDWQAITTTDPEQKRATDFTELDFRLQTATITYANEYTITAKLLSETQLTSWNSLKVKAK